MIRSIKFLSRWLLFISINLVYGLVYYVIAGASDCYWDMLDQLQKRVRGTVGPSLATSLEPLGHRRKVASLRLSIGVTLADVHRNWLNWSHFLILVADPPVILIGCMVFCNHS